MSVVEVKMTGVLLWCFFMVLVLMVVGAGELLDVGDVCELVEDTTGSVELGVVELEVVELGMVELGVVELV